MRVHIPIGNTEKSDGLGVGLLAAAFAVLMFAITFPAPAQVLFAQDNASAPAKLAVAQSGNWQTEILLRNESAAPVAFETAPCQVTPCVTRTFIAAEGSARITPLLSGFLTVPAPELDAVTLLRFDDGVTHQSYAVPPIGALLANVPQTFGAVVNDDEFMTTINVFPSQFSTITVETLSAAGEVVATETLEVLPPVAQIALSPFVTVGSIRLTSRQLFGVAGSPAPVYGFVAISDRSGGNARVLTFR